MPYMLSVVFSPIESGVRIRLSCHYFLLTSKKMKMKQRLKQSQPHFSLIWYVFSGEVFHITLPRAVFDFSEYDVAKNKKSGISWHMLFLLTTLQLKFFSEWTESWFHSTKRLYLVWSLWAVFLHVCINSNTKQYFFVSVKTKSFSLLL